MTQQNPETLAMRLIWLLAITVFLTAFVACLWLRDLVPPWLRLLLIVLSWALAAGLFVCESVRARALPDGLDRRRQGRLWFLNVTTANAVLIFSEPAGAFPTWAQAPALLLLVVCLPVALIAAIAEVFRRDDKEKQDLGQNPKHSR
jgi:hypothetical protein